MEGPWRGNRLRIRILNYIRRVFTIPDSTGFIHTALEATAYVAGARVYFWQARRTARPVPFDQRIVLLAAACIGALAGSKLLHVAQHAGALAEHGTWRDWIAGKSLLGGLLGGTLGVEAGKRLLGRRGSTGDAWVPALVAGIAIGRLGCQWSGLEDGTYGIPTALPWAWDHGDGIGRHPVALYELGAVVAMGIALHRWTSAPPGARFAAFLLGYCVLRLGLDGVKPPHFGAAQPVGMATGLHAGLTAIQWTAIAGAIGAAGLLRRRLHAPRTA